MIEPIRYPTSFQCVDCVVINLAADDENPLKTNVLVLLGKKPTETKFRLIGGFVDPKDETLEMAAIRELKEEAGENLECSSPKYLFSNRQDDPRYRNSEHKILTAVFLFQFLYGHAKGGDDIEKVEWFKWSEIVKNYKDIVVDTHHRLIEKIIENGGATFI